MIEALKRGTVGRYHAVPTIIRAAFWTTVAWAVLSLTASASLLGYRSYVYNALVRTNDKATGDKKVANYTGAAVDGDVGRVVTGGVITSSIAVLLLLVMAVLLLRGSRVARWMLVGLATVVSVVVPFGTGVLVQLVGGITVTGGAPLIYRAALILAGICSVAIVVMMFMPDTKAFYARAHPVDPDVVKRPPMLGSLFRPGPVRPAPTSKGTAGGKSVVIEADAVEPAESRAPRPPRRSSATRPGSVKPKSGGPRAPRSKSRNQ